MKKLLLIIGLLTYMSLLSAQNPPWDENIDPHWGWRYSWEDDDTIELKIDTTDLSADFFVGDSLKLYQITSSFIRYDMENVEWRPYTSTPVTLGDLLDYQRECYNDSCIVGFRYIFNYYESDDGTSYQTKECFCICSLSIGNDKWKHFDCSNCIWPEDFRDKMGFDYYSYEPIIYRPELTFEGFIKYMKKKYKR